MQGFGGLYMAAGVVLLVGGVIHGVQNRVLYEAVYLISAGFASLVTGLVLITLGELSDTSKRILTTLLSTPGTKPTECPKCGVFLVGERRFGKCFNCGAELPEAPQGRSEWRPS